MAKEKKEVVEETTKQVEQPKKETKIEIDESKFDSAGDDSVIKIDLSKPLEGSKSEEVEQQPAKEEEVVVVNEEPKEEMVEEQEDTPIVQEITEENIDEVQEEVEEAIAEAEASGKPLPEQLQKVVEFMNEITKQLNLTYPLKKETFY